VDFEFFQIQIFEERAAKPAKLMTIIISSLKK
jgi:hypothetical protein